MFVLELCRKLNSLKIPYCLVGGTAVALHGAVRGTVDVDLVIALSEAVFIEIERALMELGLEPRLPVRAREVFQFRKEYIRERSLIAWSFVDPRNPIHQVDVILTEDVTELDPVTYVIHGTKVRVASIEGLIRMKSKSDRPQDRQDIVSLKELAKRPQKGSKK